MEPALGAVAGLYRWFAGFVLLPASGSFPVVEAPFSIHNAQSIASELVASPEHAMGHCKVKCSLCSM